MVLSHALSCVKELQDKQRKHEDLLGVGTVARLKRPVFISQKGKKIFFFTEPSGISLVHTQLAVQLVRFSLLEMKLPKGKFEHTSSLRRD